MSRARAIGMVLVALAATACERRADVPPAADGAPPLAGSEWVLLTLDGQPAIKGHAVTLEFEATRLGGYAGCNWYGADWKVEAGRLAIGQAEQTLRACAGDAPMQQESAYLARLRDSTGYRIEHQRLMLADAQGNERLVFARRPVAAMDPADLVGTRWRLREDGAPARPIVVAFDANRITGFAGCRHFESDYSAQGDRITVPSTRMSDLECESGDAMLRREGAFTTDLGESSRWVLAGDVLTLSTPGGRTLVFDRER